MSDKAYGVRSVVAGSIGIILSSLYLLILWHTGSDNILARQGFLLSCLILIAFFVYHGIYCVIKTYLPKLASYAAFGVMALFGLNAAGFLLGGLLFNRAVHQTFLALSWPSMVWAVLGFLILPVLLGLGPVLWVYNKAVWLDHPTLRRWFKEGRGGSAEWAGPGTYGKRQMHIEGLYTLDIDIPVVKTKAKLGLLTDRIFLGRTIFDDHYKKELIGIKDDAMMFTVGVPGSGKSLSVLRPNLAMYRGSIVVLDMKGEHAAASFRRRSSEKWLFDNKIDSRTEKNFLHGECFALDPFGVLKKHGIPSSYYNPLSDIDLHSVNVKKEINQIVDGCVIPDKGAKGDKFWTGWSKLLLGGMIEYVLAKKPEGQQNLPFLKDLFDGIDPSLDGMANKNLFNEMLVDMAETNTPSGLAKTAGSKMLGQMPEETRGNVITTLTLGLEWAGDPAMRKHLIKSDFSFYDIGKKRIFSASGSYSVDVPQTVYIVLPFGHEGLQSRWLRTMSAVAINALRENSEKRNIPSLIMLDEFANLGGRLEAVERGMTTLRDAKVKIWPFIQDINQLKRDYPDVWNTFIAPSNVQILGVGDTETAKWVSETLGRKILYQTNGRHGFWGLYQKIRTGGTSRELLTADEILQMLRKTSNMQIILASNSRPMRLERIAFKTLNIESDKFKSFHGKALKGHYEDW